MKIRVQQNQSIKDLDVEPSILIEDLKALIEVEVKIQKRSILLICFSLESLLLSSS